MTDKEKILAKIEFLLNETNYEPFTDEVFGRIQSLKELKSYIDSLQEEPVSQDLEEAAEKYAYEEYPSVSVANAEIELAFKAGGKWHKNKINHLVDRIDVNNHSYEELEDLYDALCEITK